MRWGTEGKGGDILRPLLLVLCLPRGGGNHCNGRRQLMGEVWGFGPGGWGLPEPGPPGPAPPRSGESRDQAGCHRRGAGNKGLFFRV